MSIMIHKDDCTAGLALGLGIGSSCNKVEDLSVHSFNMKHQSNSIFGSESAHKPLLTLALSHDGFCGSVTQKVAEDVKLVKRLSSPNSTVSSYSTVYTANVKEKDVEEGEVERGSSRVSDEDDDGSPKKKLRLTKEQSALLEDRFKEHSTLNPKQKQALAKQLNLRPRQVEVWFQNRRARTKLKQTEVDCEFLKSCCERLTEENQRLHKEVLELKALKYAQPLYMQFPAATLKICPSCEKINGVNDSSRLRNDSAREAGPFVVAPKPRNTFTNPFSNSASC